MKKILFLFAFLSITICSLQAQTSLSPTVTNPTSAVLNATTDTLNLSVSPVYYEIMTIQALLTKSSGTMAGTVRLYGSNFNNVSGAWEAVGDTLTLSNSTTNVHTWTLIKPSYKYYQLLQNGGTTVAGTMVAKAYAIRNY